MIVKSDINLQALKSFSSENYFSSFMVCTVNNEESEEKHGDV